MRWRSTLMIVLTCLFAVGCGGAEELAEPAAEPAAAEEPVADADHGHDEPANERDMYSMPNELLAFAEVGAGDTVLDLMAGGGYNSEHAAAAVGSEGRVIVHNGREEFQDRVAGGEMASASPYTFLTDLGEVADNSVDTVLSVRAYHLFPEPAEQLAHLFRVTVPGGVVAVVEVRSNEEEGHDMETHRLGEGTVIADFEAAGFEYVGASDVLRRDDDDYSVFAVEGKPRYIADRMLLKFRKPGDATT